MKTIADIEIRSERDEDFDAVAAIHCAIYPDWPVTADEMREYANEVDPARYVRARLVAEDRRRGLVVAAAAYHQLPWSFHPDRYRIRLMVHPDWQGRGIGRRLMDEMMGQLTARGAKWVQARAREDFVRALAFVQQYGFAEYARSFESRLDVAQVDLSRFARYQQRAAELGITFTTLVDELKQRPDCLPAVYQMHCTLDIGAPRDNPELPTPPTFEEFMKHSVHSSRALPDAYFLAKFREMYVGETVLKRSDADPTFLHQELTGVLSDLRGLGVATALKVQGIEYARRHGYTQVQTFNSSKNDPMLAINTKFGFIRKPAWIELQKTL
jgi:mycothiol synthase